jgi:hypothetical protein
MNNTTPPSFTVIAAKSPLLVAANLWTGHPAVAASIWMVYGISQLGIQVFSSQAQDNVAHLHSKPSTYGSALRKSNEILTENDFSNAVQGSTNSKTSNIPVIPLTSSHITRKASNSVTIRKPSVTAPQPLDAYKSTLAWLSSAAPGAAEPSEEPANDTHTTEAPRFSENLLDSFHTWWEFLLLNFSVATGVLERFDLHSYWNQISSYTEHLLALFGANVLDR